MNNKIADNFINKKTLSRTIQFNVLPMYETLEYINERGIIEADAELNEKALIVKQYINEYHRYFTNSCLSDYRFSEEDLERYLSYRLLSKMEKDEKKEFLNLTKKMREDIHNAFEQREEFDQLDGKDLIKTLLPEYYKDDADALKLIKEFNGTTSIFSKFNKSKMFMYSKDDKHGTIAHRVVTENLSKYTENISKFNSIFEVEEVSEDFKILEEEVGVKLKDYFEINGFNLVLTQAGIDKYNCIIGGIAKEDGEKIKGVNEIINLYNQKFKKRLPLLKKLFKQILSISDTPSFVLEKIDSDLEVFDSINLAYTSFMETVVEPEEYKSITDLLSGISNYDLSNIYIKTSDLNYISNVLFGEWNIILDAIRQDYKTTHKCGRSLRKFEEDMEKYIKDTKVFSIEYINDCLQKFGRSAHVENYYILTIAELLHQVDNAYLRYSNININKYIDGRSLKSNDPDKATIQKLLDAINKIRRTMKSLEVTDDSIVLDLEFYNNYDKLLENLDPINKLYNRVRNYVTSKPYSNGQLKLYFGAGDRFLGGWSSSVIKEKRGIILRKDDDYYFGIISETNKKWTENLPESCSDDTYSLMDYKTVSKKNGAGGQLSVIFHLKDNMEFAALSDTEKIEYIMDKLSTYDKWDDYHFKFKKPEEYTSYKDFVDDIDKQGYCIAYNKVDSDYIRNLVKNGELYLFKFNCRDFSPYSKGIPNLHTMYFKMIFECPEQFMLRGNAELFFRKKSLDIKDTTVHKAGIPIKNSPLAINEKSCFSYDIIKDRRYLVDSFILHIPISINKDCKEMPDPKSNLKDFNSDYNMVIKEAALKKNMNVIGIDRGENNLIYITVVDMNGDIIYQKSYNEIESHSSSGHVFRKNYNDLLTEREKKNADAKKSWGTIESNKKTKEGYIGKIVHEITRLQDKYNAIIVLENLDSDFKRRRQIIEKNIYTEFENALINKLMYCVDKCKDYDENGGLKKGYQLAAPFLKENAGKTFQSGIVYFVNPAYTSKIDPTTGFTNLFDSRYKDINSSKEFISKFDRIYYDEKMGMYAFSFDYNNYTGKAGNAKTDWTVYTNGTRLRKYKNGNIWSKECVELTTAFDNLFSKYSINRSQFDMRKDILNIEKSDFYKEFMSLFYLVVMMRSSDNETGVDEIISPVLNRNGEFFRTDVSNPSIPANGDGNGSYCIAKKGLMILDRLMNTSDEEICTSKPKYIISNSEWFSYLNTNGLKVPKKEELKSIVA